MKTFFSKSDVRKEVLGATELYFRSVSDPEYVFTSHYLYLRQRFK
jgi:hypothetical protein